MTSQQVLALVVSVACGAVIPAVVDVVTKSHAPRTLKALIAAALAALAGALSTVTFTAGERPATYVSAVGMAFLSMMLAHSTGWTRTIQAATAGFGIGPTKSTTTDAVSSTETA